MVDLQVIINTGTNTVLTEEIVEAFQASLRGPLLQPGDAGAMMTPASCGMG